MLHEKAFNRPPLLLILGISAMSKINIRYRSAADLYAIIYNGTLAYNQSSDAFEVFSISNLEAGYYAYDMDDQSDGTYISLVDFPSVAIDDYDIYYYERVDGSEENTQDLEVAYSLAKWNGSILSDQDQQPIIDLDAYTNIRYANQFFHNRLRQEAWTDATTINQARALNMATIYIDRLNFAGTMSDEDQTHQFPRYDDDDYPQDIIDATCLIASKLLDDFDVDDLREEGRVNFQAYGSVKQSYKNIALPHIVAGIPSAEAWDLLVPYLRQGGTIRLDRVT